MIKHEDIQKFYDYKGSFAKFLLDFYGIETDQDLDSLDARVTEPEELIVAHIVWKMLFGDIFSHYMIVVPTQTLAVFWQGRILDSIAQLPDCMTTKPIVTRGCIEVGTFAKTFIRVCSENIARGMTLNGVYIVEPQLNKKWVYEEFMASIIPAMFSTNGQIVQYSRGY